MSSENNITIQEMLDLSEQLWEQHKDTWPHTPESNISWLAWLVGEVAEVIEIVKKKGPEKIMNDPQTREDTLEEITDCYMYLADIINRYEFTAEEFSEAYMKKMNHNLGRDYTQSKTNAEKVRENT